MKKWLSGILALTLAASILAGCGGTAPKTNENQASAGDAKDEPLKVAFVYIGPPGDGGYTYMHDKGRQDMEAALGDKVQTTYVENVPETADAERVFENLAQQGNKVIFGTSFGYMDAMVAVAQRHPDVVFMHATGYKTAENLGTYMGRNHQGFYLAGIAAGEQLKGSASNTIGFVAAFPIPEVIRAINAFTLGARSVNPDAKVKVVWSYTWFDPTKEKDAAKALLDAGVDGIAMYQDSPAPLVAAQEAGKFAIGNHSDAREHAPQAFLTAPVWNWGPYYTKAVQSVIDGTWKSEQYWGGMDEGIVDVAPLADFAKPEAKAKIDEMKGKIVSGEYKVFTGPIKDQAGVEKVKAGETLSDQDQLEMMWFVEGVEGTIPES